MTMMTTAVAAATKLTRHTATAASPRGHKGQAAEWQASGEASGDHITARRRRCHSPPPRTHYLLLLLLLPLVPDRRQQQHPHPLPDLQGGPAPQSVIYLFIYLLFRQGAKLDRYTQKRKRNKEIQKKQKRSQERPQLLPAQGQHKQTNKFKGEAAPLL
jgi:hypothetical protein